MQVHKILIKLRKISANTLEEKVMAVSPFSALLFFFFFFFFTASYSLSQVNKEKKLLCCFSSASQQQSRLSWSLHMIAESLIFGPYI